MFPNNKKVTFSHRVEVHFIPKQDDCRERYWEHVAIDRLRFKRRVYQFEQIYIKNITPSNNIIRNQKSNRDVSISEF